MSERLELQITAEESQALHALDSLVSSLERIKGAVSKGFSSVSNHIEKLTASLSVPIPEDNISRIERMADALERIKSSSSGEIGFSALLNSASGFRSVQQSLQEVNTSSVSAVQSIKETENSMDVLAPAAHEAAEGTKEYSDSVREAGSASSRSAGAISKVAKAFGRIAFYRAIRASLKAITEGFKEGVTNVKAYSQAIGGSFAKDMASASATMATFKNSIGAAVAPALQSLIPILNAVASAVIVVVNLLNQFFSLLRGGGSWTRAKTVSESLDGIKKSAGGAGGAIKGLLADWDELNIIQSQGGGGGGGSAGIDYEDMFEEVEAFDSRVKAIVEWLQSHMGLVNAAIEAGMLMFAGWALPKVFKADLAEIPGKIAMIALKWIGLTLAIYGAKNAYAQLKEQWDNGVDLENMKGLVSNLNIAVFGLGIAFGANGLGFGLIAAGIAEMIAPIKELIEEINSGKDAIEALRTLSDEAFAQLEIGIFELGLGVSLLTGNWIPVAIAGVVDLVLWAVREWDNIVDAFKRAWEGIGNWVYENVTMPVGNFFIDMANAVVEAINTVIRGINSISVTIPAIEGLWDETHIGFDIQEIGLIDRMRTLSEKNSNPVDALKDPNWKAPPKRNTAATMTAAEDSMRGYEETVKELKETTASATVTQDDYLQTIKQGVNELNAQGYASFEEKLEAVNRLVEEGQNAMQEAREEAEAYGGTMAGVAASIPTETQTLVVPDVVQMPESSRFDYEVDTGDVAAIYDALYRAMLDYDPADSGMDSNELWDYLFDSFLLPLSEMSGLAEDELGPIADAFYDALIQKLFDENFDPTFIDMVDALKNAIENPEDGFKLPTVDDSAMDTGLSDSVTKVQGYVNSIRAALESLNGVGFSFGWSGFGGTFKTVGMAAEGGMFTAGQLFIAREAGPEMIGQMGNRSTVANNDQIVTGIAGGVAAGQQEQNALLRQQNDLLMRMLNKKFTAEVVPSAALAKVNRRSEEMYARNTGVSG